MEVSCVILIVTQVNLNIIHPSVGSLTLLRKLATRLDLPTTRTCVQSNEWEIILRGNKFLLMTEGKHYEIMSATKFSFNSVH